MTPTDPQLLKDLAYLNGASPELLDAIAAAGKPRRFATGETILREGSTGRELYLILEGSVEVFKGQGDDRIRLGKRDAGELVGEMALFDAGERSATVLAAEPMLTLEFSATDAQAIWTREPRLLYHVVQGLTARLRHADLQIIEDLTRKNQELARAYAELKAAQAALVEKEKLERELELARHLQQSMLPRHFPAIAGYSLAAHSRPARQVGGDFYDVIAVDERRAAFVMADVSDKGMPAALYMALTRSLIRAEAQRSGSPREILLHTHQLLNEISQNNMFFTAFCCVLDPTTGALCYARAGHDRPLLLNPTTGEHRWLGGRGMLLGPMADVHLEEVETSIGPGESLVLYTDGITDANAPDGAFFGEERLLETVQQAGDASARDLCRQIIAAVEQFQAGADQFDDMSIMVLARKDAPQDLQAPSRSNP
jgi:serine phosphatase RsbU (regulator of sigma subunit)